MGVIRDAASQPFEFDLTSHAYRDSEGNAVGYRAVYATAYPVPLTERQAARQASDEYASVTRAESKPPPRRRLCGFLRGVGRATWRSLKYAGWVEAGAPTYSPDYLADNPAGYQTRPM